MTDPAIREELTDGVLTVVFDRPDKRNALTIAMRQQIAALPRRCKGADDVRCVVITGAGGTFTAGADLTEMREYVGEIPSTSPTVGIAAIDCPVIAAVDGVCVTGGLEIALACDVILASPGARFADTHASLGVIPRWGMSQLLPARIGTARATEMMLTGRWVEAAEAERIGLADRVIHEPDFGAAVHDLAVELAGRDPAVVEALGRLVAENRDRSFAGALAAEAEVGAAFGLGGG